MTIEVIVTNIDTRENAVIVVKTLNKEGAPSGTPEVELSGGRSKRFLVHSGQNLVVEEVKNG